MNSTPERDVAAMMTRCGTGGDGAVRAEAVVAAVVGTGGVRRRTVSGRACS